MACLFIGEYRLTWEMLHEADYIIFEENDTGNQYFLKKRNDNTGIEVLSFFDIPREFFQEKNALIDFVSNDSDPYTIVCTINGPIFRYYMYGSDEWHPKTFQEELRDKEMRKSFYKAANEILGSMEGSSETIETESDND